MPDTTILTSPSDLSLEPLPINPEWIIDGSPTARCRLLWRSADSSSYTVLWDCTAGSFRWFYAGDETVHVMEGGMTLTDDTGTRRVGPGDVVFFPAGSSAVWVVDEYVRKLAFLRAPLPRYADALMRIVRTVRSSRLARIVGLGRAGAGSSSGALAMLAQLVIVPTLLCMG